MKQTTYLWAGAALFALQSACSLTPSRPIAIDYRPIAHLTAEQQEQAEAMYNYLLGQVAGVHSSLAEQQRDEEAAKAYLDIAVPSLAAASAEIDDPELAKQAMKAADYAEKPEQAYTAARRWAELSPGDIQAQQYAALAAMKMGHTDDALTHIGLIIELSPAVDDGLKTVAALLQREASLEQVLPVTQQLIEWYPQSPRAMLIEAEALLRFKKYEESLKRVDATLGLQPAYKPAKLLKVKVLRRLEREDEALALLAAETASQPDDMELRVAYARLLVSEKRYAEGRQQYEVVFNKNPNNAELAYRLGMLSLELKQPDLAEEYLLHVLNLGKRTQASLFHLGRIAEQREEYRSALQYYMRVKKGDYRMEALLREARMLSLLGEPDDGLEALSNLQRQNTDPNLDVRFYLFKADILIEQKKFQRAYDVVEEALGKHSDHFDLLFIRSMLTEQLGRIDESIADLEALLERQPDNADVLNALGYTLTTRTTQYVRARALIEKAYTIKPGSAAIADSMAWVIYKLGDLEQAEVLIRKAFKLDQDPEIAAHKGEILWERGAKEEARAVWGKALQKAPDHEILNQTIQKYQK